MFKIIYSLSSRMQYWYVKWQTYVLTVLEFDVSCFKITFCMCPIKLHLSNTDKLVFILPFLFFKSVCYLTCQHNFLCFHVKCGRFFLNGSTCLSWKSWDEQRYDHKEGWQQERILKKALNFPVFLYSVLCYCSIYSNFTITKCTRL